MREQDPKKRIKNFNEVPYGYSEEEAVAEAKPAASKPTTQPVKSKSKKSTPKRPERITTKKESAPAAEPTPSKRYYVEDEEGHHHGPLDDYEEAASVAEWA